MKIKYWDTAAGIGDIRQIDTDRDLKVGIFNNCTVHGITMHYPLPLIYTNEQLLLPTIERFMSLGRGTVYEDTMAYDIEDIQINKKETTPVFYFVYNCANYFHWIYDTVPYLSTYFRMKEEMPDLKILINVPDGQTDLYDFVYETLDLLGITKNDLMFIDPSTEYETMIIGSSLTHNRQSLDPPHPDVFSIINSMSGIESSEDKIYVSRRTWTKSASKNIGTDYTTERKCTNEDDVVELFKSYGFKEIFAEDLDMKEKIGIFKSAKYVAGPIGGGLANVLFCNSECNVISINSPEFFDINDRLKYALTHTNLHMFDDTQFEGRRNDVITGTSALSISGGMNSPWSVNIDKLKNLIESIL